jgi:DNA-binding IclR family transcriptional regulator
MATGESLIIMPKKHEKMKRAKSNYSIQTVEHALDVLEQFLVDGRELGVTELSRRTRLNKNSIFRLLATLESRHFIEQNEYTDGYRLGVKSLELGQSVLRQMEFHHQARSVLESLVKDCNETADVAILKGAHIYYLHAVESNHPVRVVPRIGLIPPAFCTAAGKVLLACTIDKGDWKDLFRNLRQYAPNTITDPLEFTQQLEKVITEGYALEDEELDAGVRGIAAPIRDYSGCVIGSVSISGPVMRFGKARVHDELVPMVVKSAEKISSRLGYYYDEQVNRALHW